MEISGGGSRVGWLIPGRPGLGRNWSRLTGAGSEEAVADTTTPQPTSCRVGNKAKPPTHGTASFLLLSCVGNAVTVFPSSCPPLRVFLPPFFFIFFHSNEEEKELLCLLF
jgi:hypothetical protein